jgi:hypothetical protein
VSDSVEFEDAGSHSRQRRHQDACTTSTISSSQQHQMNKTIKSGSSFSRAVAYLQRRSPSSIVVVDAPVHTSEQQSAASIRHRRVQDPFSTELNECCDASTLADLRKKRAEVSPIIIYESDDEEENATDAPAEFDVAFKSRLEALHVQQRLLGKDHPDVNFMILHMDRLQCRRSSRPESCSAARHYLMTRHRLYPHNVPSFQSPS